MMKNKPLLHKVVLILLGGVVLCFYAFYNNYPLLYPDTGSYIYFGFIDGVPHDRPKTYGLFLRHISLAEITWLVVLVQGIILSTLIYLLFKYFLPWNKILPLHFICIVFLTFFTGISVTTSTLMPDVFAPIFLLALALLLIVPLASKRDIYLVSVFLWLGIIMHNSHAIIAIGILAILTLLTFFTKKIKLRKKQLMRAWIITVIGLLSIPSIHFVSDQEFVLSKGSHIFIMAHLVEVGVVDDYLKNNCSSNEYQLCNYQEAIPTDLIWDYKNSPLHLEYGAGDVWEDSREEYEQIIGDILTTPKYLTVLFYKSFTYTAKQFFSFDTGDTDPQLENSTSYGSVDWFYKNENREMLLALQQRRNHLLDYSSINTYQRFLFFFSLCIGVLLFFVPSIRANLSYPTKLLLLFILIGLLVNAFVCSNFSTVVPRYQSRIIWLLPLSAGIVLIEWGKGYLKRKKIN